MLEAEKRGLDRPAGRSAVAVALVIATFLLRQFLVLHSGFELPAFFLLYPAVLLLALFFGLWPGVLATFLAAVLADYWILPPTGHFRLARTSEVMVLALFVVVGVSMSLLAERYRRIQRRAVVLERQQAQRESEERFSALVAATSDVVYRMSPDWKEVRHVIGRGFIADANAPTTAWLQQYIPPEDQPRVRSAIIQAIRTRNRFQLEHRVIRVDGTLGWVLSRAVPLLDSDGKIVEWLGTLSDFTERKQSEDALREREALLRESHKIAGLGTFILDLRTGEWKRSEVLEELFGIDSSYDHTLAGWLALIHPEDRAMVEGHLTVDVIGRGQPFLKDYRIIRPSDHAVRWIHGRRGLEFDAAGKPAILRSTTQDITEQKETDDRLQLAASVFSHASEGIMITAPDGAILDVNDAFSRITGYTREEVLGRNPSLLSSGRQDHDFYEGMWNTLIEKGEWSGEIWNRNKSGETYSASQTITAVLDVNGHIRQYVALFHDNTLLKEHEQRLEQIAYYDALTGLPNRILLSDRLRRAMIQTRRRKQLLAVALLDLDGFKSVNDGHGHDVGDRLLSALAVRMKHALREGDTLARLGGDEFVAVLPDLGSADAGVPIITRLLDAASEAVEIGKAIIRVSASVGVTFYPQAQDQDADQLLRQADQAMYQAKVTGRNCYQFFDSAQGRSAADRQEGLDRIRQALAADEFVLYYQPKVNMATGEVVGAEALIRWQQPEGALLLPASFLPFVEGHPLAVELSEWVIDTALAQMESWQSAGLDLPVSVNVGAQHLLQDQFVEHLCAHLAAHPRIRPSRLELEVLESSALQDIVLVSKILDACHKAGVSIALDDFGSGYSSLTYLKLLPADVLKIDQSFVREIVSKAENQAILEAVLGLAVALHRQVIAEGVETIEHGLMLLKTGYELAQGYAIAYPMQASDLPAWFAAWHPDPRWVNANSTKKAARSPGAEWSQSPSDLPGRNRGYGSDSN
jgi:diguanylate cyclase (GGDEF)-like protein/PAS domain S-box-containing protein